MAENYVVYSEHIKGIAPHLENNDIYAYTLSNDLVLVCVDLNVKEDELADEERFYDEPPLYGRVQTVFCPDGAGGTL